MSAPDAPTAATRTRFAHHRLDAYRVAVEVFVEVERIAAGFPAGHAELKDQVRRAAAATVRNIAEGANRVHTRGKAARHQLPRTKSAPQARAPTTAPEGPAKVSG